jgi:hypothetical protein
MGGWVVYEAYEAKKKRENYAVFYFAGKIKMFFYIYDVITLEILKKRSIYHYICIYIYIYIGPDYTLTRAILDKAYTECVAAGRPPKMLLLCSPCNPTGLKKKKFFLLAYLLLIVFGHRRCCCCVVPVTPPV